MDNGKYNGLYCRGHEKRVELVKKYNIKLPKEFLEKIQAS